MSIQPRLERFKNIQLTNRELIWMLVGFAAGLLLGLLISWAWWPVEAGTSVTTSVAVSTPPVSTPETTSNDGNGANSLLIVFGVLLAFIGGGAIAWLYQQGAFGGGSAQTAVVGPLEQGGVEAREKETVARSELEVDDVRSSFGSSSARSGISGHETVRAVSSVVPPTRPPATAASVAPFEEEEEGLPSPFSGASASMRSTSQSIAPSVAASASFSGGLLVDDSEEEALSGDEERQSASLATRERAMPSAAGWPVGISRSERYPTIDTMEVKYVAGSQQLDWTRNIPGSNEDVYLGEYGVGVSERYGILNNDPDQVVAMEVYIFDKSDDKNLSTVGRIILSEYADTHLRKHFEREKDRLGPIVAQPNTLLQLETRQFLLLCRIVDVAYRDGIFERLEMKLELKRKS
ncbi:MULTISPECIES: hypothetical protein [Caldilinea]|jgi:hypothetical protein|nr:MULTISPECIES: hypothetical protein [Caldilinea]MBO9391501.1 hypothetical protein [Caldilinea sp.]GIV75202.1 MAG: hypothetical protein KatS3mg049_3758 [Caldilinea sp.]